MVTFVQVNSGVVAATGPGGRSKDGSIVPISVKEGDTVLLPEYGGSNIKLGEKE
jgi:chaperonin GroES